MFEKSWKFLAPLAVACSSLTFGDVRIYVLDGGHGELKKTGMLVDTSKFKGRELPLASPCFLIQDGRRWLLWDTGLSDSLVGKPQDLGAVALSKTKTMSQQLETLGLKPEDITFIAFSHLHFDHTGTANLFGKSTWLMERRELKYAYGKPTPPSFDPSTFSAYLKARHRVLKGDYDVFGDGRVKILFTPGHTPGHCSLLVKLKKSGFVLLSGDLYHSRQNYADSWVPSINTSRSETVESFRRVRVILSRVHGRLIIQHDPGDFANLPKIPKYLD